MQDGSPATKPLSSPSRPSRYTNSNPPGGEGRWAEWPSSGFSHPAATPANTHLTHNQPTLRPPSPPLTSPYHNTLSRYSNANPSGGKGRWAEWFFQWAFAATAATIPAGAVAERFNFHAYLAYTLLVSAWVYPVVVHWVWAPRGWLSAFNTTAPLFGSGMIDFAGACSGVGQLER